MTAYSRKYALEVAKHPQTFSKFSLGYIQYYYSRARLPNAKRY